MDAQELPAVRKKRTEQIAVVVLAALVVCGIWQLYGVLLFAGTPS